MLLHRLALLLLLVSCEMFAQQPEPVQDIPPDQCTIAFYAQDSVAMRMKGFKPLFDSAAVMEKRISDLQNQAFVATDKALMLKPDSGEVLTAEENKAYSAAQSEANKIEASIVEARHRLAGFKMKNLQPYYNKIAKVADTVSRNKGIKQVFETNSEPPLKCPTDQTLMVDITRDIGEHLGLKMQSFRIGIVNKDSLMRLIPGYAVRADSTIRETHELDSLVELKNIVIAAKQHELDSLRPTLSGRKTSQREEEIQKLKDERDEFYGWRAYNIDKRHEERSKSYVTRLNAALAAAAKENGCKYYYDRGESIPWTDREAEFVDLNAVVVKNLKP